MKGLLHRLAARAAGTTVPVRSDVRLPFGGGMGWGGVGEADGDGESAVRASVAHAPAAVDGLSAAPRVFDVPRLSSAVTPMGDAPLPSMDAPVTHASVPPRARRYEFDAAERAVHGVAGDGVSPGHVPAPLVEMPAEATPPANRPSLGIDAAVSQPSSAAQTMPQDIAPPARRAASADAPPVPARLMPVEPLLPVPAATAIVVPRTAGGLHPQFPVAERGDATEVHVHIGRVDVTAVHEPPAPRRRPTATPQPLSLDAYLAKKGRG